MNITSIVFFSFAILVLVVYYNVPRRCQWYVLLIASILFYLSIGAKSFLYVLITASTVYASTMRMQKLGEEKSSYLKANKEQLSREEKNAVKKEYAKKRKRVMLIALLINVLILCVFKYYHFVFEQINAVIGLCGGKAFEDTATFIVPLGISFYTFQSIGYLVDVYWEYYEPEKNYFKTLLFVSFFPQMTQGPISSFEQLSTELFTEHSFEYKNYSWGMYRMLWGFIKKMLIANTLSIYVNEVFRNYSEYTGITVLIGAFMYSVQIYADFSGYMDIMCGYCEMLGIRLTENFERPYFSKSVAEYWRRWHITLGVWFKKYIYYPIGMSNWARSLGKTLTNKFGRTVGVNVPATLALIIVWFATGLWHGASWGYIVWGGVNGFFIILTLWLEPIYQKMIEFFHIDSTSKGWRNFQILRTFILITIIKVLPEVGGLRKGLGLWKHVLVNHEIPAGIRELFGFMSFSNISLMYFAVAMCGTAVMFWFSVMQRKKPVRERLSRFPYWLRILIASGMVALILMFGFYGSFRSGNGGFLYAQF